MDSRMPRKGLRRVVKDAYQGNIGPPPITDESRQANFNYGTGVIWRRAGGTCALRAMRLAHGNVVK
jgi:hypothetical protein